MNEVRIDGRDLKPRPCSVCEEEINELILSYEEEADYVSIESELIEYDEETNRHELRETDLGDPERG